MDVHADLWERWLDLWNGDLSLLDHVIAPHVAVHRTGGAFDTNKIHRPADFVEWIRITRSLFPDLRIEAEVGPIFGGDLIAARWVARGTYAGGVPGAAAAPGTAVSFSGTDILRVADGLVAEYWLNDDLLSLYEQLGIVPVPGGTG